ncbi:MAG: hypothetical protein RMJ85_12295 [Anaerolineales bacterium]|nr:hypothetical protein [Anaerolineales bacterium]
MTRLRFLTVASLYSWLFVSLALFVLSNRVTYLQLFLFPDMLPWQQASLRALNEWVFLREILRALLGVGLFSLAAFLTGAAFFRWDKISLLPVLSSFALGQVVFSLIFLALLSINGLPAHRTTLLVILCALPGVFRFRWALRANLFLRRAVTTESVSAAIPSAFSVATSVFILIAALGLSSSRLGYDATAYYFSHARLMAVTGHPLFTYAGDAFVVSSFHPGILFTVIIQLFGDQAARMLSWVNGGVLLLAGWAMGNKVGLSARARWFFITLLLTSTAFVDLLGDGKVELISTAPLVVALWWMADSLQTPSRGRFLLMGALLGFAIIARPYNLFLVPVFTIAFYLFQLWPVFRAQGLKAALAAARPVLWMFPTLLLMGAFHLWQNNLWLGSPLAPLAYARELDSGDWQWQFDPAMLNALRLFYPLTITFLNTPQSLGNISPLFVGFLPFLLLPGIRKRLVLSESLRSLLLPALLTLVLWVTLFFTVVEIRYVFFLWVLFFLFGAQVIEAAFDALESGYRTILRAALAVLLAFTLVRTLVISLATYSPIDSNGRAHCYDIPFCTFFDPLNESAPLGARVFVLNAYRYYLRADLFACSSQAGEYAPLQAFAKQKSGQFWAELYRQGFQYITYEKNFAEVHSHFGALPPLESAPAWMRIETISSIGDQAVYQLSAINPPVSPLKTCLQTNDGLWRVTERR